MTPVTVTDVRAFDPGTDLEEALAVLDAGGVLVHPTETIYGFGGSLDPRTVGRVQEMKGRADDKPLLVLVPGPGAVPDLVWSDEARELAAVFWPGAVTLVLRDPENRFPPGVRSREGGVAVRQSSHPVVAALLRRFGAPLTSTSANRPGEPAARTGDEAMEVLRALDPRFPVHLLDAGVLPPSAPSTILDCTGPDVRVLREGAVPVSRLRCLLPKLDASS